MEKKGQVTIYIIIGILVVVAVILVFVFQNDLGIANKINTNPTLFIERCSKDAISPILTNIESHGGVYYAGPTDPSFRNLNGSIFAIICTTNESSAPCVNKHPSMIEEIRSKIKQLATSKVDSCFNQFRDKNPNVDISLGSLDFDVEIVKSSVSLKIRKPLTIVSGENSNYYENFDFSFSSDINGFVELINVIANTESTCECYGRALIEDRDPFSTNIPQINCDADISKLIRAYPGYVFYRESISPGEKLYTIESLGYSKNLSFVIKNCHYLNTISEVN